MAKTLKIWTSHNPLEDFRQEMDALFSRLMGPNKHSTELMPLIPPVETLIDGKEFVVRIDLPGIDPNDVEITVSDNLLTIRGSREHHHENEAQNFIHCELAHGTFERSITLPQGIRPEDLKAVYRNGVLEVRMPAPKQLAGHKVPIQVESAESKKADGHQQKQTSS